MNRPSPRRRPPDRREQILAAAVTLFRTMGFRGTSIDDIGAAVGMTGPAVYRYFESKEALLMALFEIAGERARSDIEASRGEGLSPHEVIAGMVERSIDHAIEESALVMVASREVQHLSPDARRNVQRMQQELAATWNAALRRVRPELSEREAGAIVIGVAALIRAATRGHQLAPDSARALFTRMATAALLA